MSNLKRVREIVLAVVVISGAMTTPVFAQMQGKYALGNMYTMALNMIESCGMLNTLGSDKQVTVTNIHMDHGQVLVILTGEGGPVTIAYDPIAHQILSGPHGSTPPVDRDASKQ